MSGKLLTGALIAPWMAGVFILNANDSTSVTHDPIVAPATATRTTALSAPNPLPASMQQIEARMRHHLESETAQQRAIQQLTELATHEETTARPPAMPTQPATHVLWTPHPASGARMIERPAGYPEPLLRVSLNGLRLDTLRAGDQLELPPIAGSTYVAAIDSVVRPMPGVTQVSATVEAFGTEGTVTLTQGQVHTFGTIATPSDTFELDAVGDYGEIFATRDLDRLIDYTKNDYLPIPDQGSVPKQTL
ncbi:MAG: hypothetical protein ACFCUJ_02460 [Thiotrichales bacterium]